MSPIRRCVQSPPGKVVLLVLLVWFGASGVQVPSAHAQQAERMYPKLQRTLEGLFRSTAAPTKLAHLGARLEAQVPGPGAPLKVEEGRVQVVVEAVSAEATAQINEFLQEAGARVERVYEGLVQAYVPVQALPALAQLPQVAFVRQPVQAFTSQSRTVTSEGVQAMDATEWQGAGLTGQGVKVGIIDVFGGYEELLGTELPETVTAQSFASHEEFFPPGAPFPHGTAVAEIIHDIAPQAELFFAYFETDVEFRQAVDWMIEQDVDVVNTSLGFFSRCFGTDQGIFESKFAKAKASGITWATSAGNEAEIHWEGSWNDPDSNGLHNYTPSDEGNTIDVVLEEFVYEDGERVATSVIEGALSWDASCSSATDDYEVVVFREDSQGRLAELPAHDGRVGQVNDWLWRPGVPIKVFFASEDFNPSRIGEAMRYHVGIRKLRQDAADARLDMFLSNCEASCQYHQAQGSLGMVEPAASESVITVGAAHHSPSGCPLSLCPSKPLLAYSSQGPTKDGRIKPDITGPSHVSTVAFGRWTGNGRSDNFGFTGTSASSPHVAGAAALVLGAFPAFSPDDVAQFLQGRGEDVGETGKDSRFGAGLLVMGQPPSQATLPTPANVSAQALSSDTIELSWEDTAQTETGFRVERRMIDEDFQAVSTVEANHSDFTDSGLSPDTEYCYRVTAVDPSTESDPSPESCARTMALALDSGRVVGASIEPLATSPNHAIEVPAGTAQLLIQLRGESDLDLYVRVGERVAEEQGTVAADFAARSPASSESLSIANPAPGTYFIAVRSQAAVAQPFSLVAALIPLLEPQIRPLALGQPSEAEISAEEVVQYAVDLDAGASSLAVLLESLGAGDFRLHVRYGQPVALVAGAVVADWSSSSGAGVESIVLMGAALRPGRYYIAVENLEPYAQRFRLTVTV